MNHGANSLRIIIMWRIMNQLLTGSQTPQPIAAMSGTKRSFPNDDIGAIQEDGKRQRREENRQRRKDLDNWLADICSRTGISAEQCLKLRRVAHLKSFKDFLCPDESVLSQDDRVIMRRFDAEGRAFLVHNIEDDVQEKLILSLRQSLPQCARPAWLQILMKTMPKRYTKLALDTTMDNMKVVTRALIGMPLDFHLSGYIQAMARPSMQDAMQLVQSITKLKTPQQICDDVFKQLIQRCNKFVVPARAVETTEQKLQRLARRLLDRETYALRSTSTTSRVWVGDSAHTFGQNDFTILVRVVISDAVGVIVRFTERPLYIQLLTALRYNCHIDRYATMLGIEPEDRVFRGCATLNDIEVYTCDKYDSKIEKDIHLRLVKREGLSDLMVKAQIRQSITLSTYQDYMHMRSRHQNAMGMAFGSIVSVPDLMQKIKARWNPMYLHCSISITSKHRNIAHVNAVKNKDSETLQQLQDALYSNTTASLFDPEVRTPEVLTISIDYDWNVSGVCSQCKNRCLSGDPDNVHNNIRKGHMVYIDRANMFVCNPELTE